MEFIQKKSFYISRLHNRLLQTFFSADRRRGWIGIPYETRNKDVYLKLKVTNEIGLHH